MPKSLSGTILCLLFSLPAFTALADDAAVSVPMHARPSGTYYLKAGFGGSATNDLMLDTGSEFLVINEATLKTLLDNSQADYLHHITGIMADGSKLKVPVYRLSSLSIGCCCVVRDIAAAVFPGNTREILGLTALRKVAPFAVSLEPAVLTLNNCRTTPASQTAVNQVHTDELPVPSEIASMTKN